MVDKQGVPLASIEDFPAEVVERLSKLWLTIAEELAVAAQTRKGIDGLAVHLGVTEDYVEALVRLAEAELPAGATGYGQEEERYALGALDLPDQWPAGAALDFDVTSLPAKVDQHQRLMPARNQQQRPTCVAFASSAAREFMLGARSLSADLSEQFLYWACKQRDNWAGGGTYLKTAMAVLEDIGTCVEELWPYNPISIPGNEGQGAPPAAIIDQAHGYRIGGWTPLDPGQPFSLCRALADGQLVVLVVKVYDYWFKNPVRLFGDVRLPLPTEQSPGGHAVCAVGYEVDPSVPGKGVFYVRNSWGEDWARSSPIAPGYCRLPYAYVEQYGNVACTPWSA